jgi:FkbM family methyltransferase
MIELAKKWFGEHPLGFVDIGARGGVHPLVEPIAGYVAWLGFEPDKEACAALNGPGGFFASSLCLPVALSDQTGPAVLYRCAAPTNDSLRPINKRFVDRYKMEKFAQTGKERIEITTLDDALSNLPLQGEFLKLDTQGTEYDILQGARDTLHDRTAAIYCEVEFAEVYMGQALFSEIDVYLRAFGFSFIGFDNMSYRSRTPWKGRERLLHADALFIKDPVGKMTSYRQGLVAAMACLLCGYDDFAKEIMGKMGV